MEEMKADFYTSSCSSKYITTIIRSLQLPNLCTSTVFVKNRTFMIITRSSGSFLSCCREMLRSHCFPNKHELHRATSDWSQSNDPLNILTHYSFATLMFIKLFPHPPSLRASSRLLEISFPSSPPSLSPEETLFFSYQVGNSVVYCITLANAAF